MTSDIKDATERHVDSHPETLVLDSASEKKLLRKLDSRLLPAVSILYLLSFLDRSNGKWK
jgi:hypothetical protein